MKTVDLASLGIWWFIENTPLVIQVLIALVPVLALCIAGYALHVVAQREKDDRK